MSILITKKEQMWDCNGLITKKEQMWDCNGKYTKDTFLIPFRCPSCGEDLTEEAWAHRHDNISFRQPVYQCRKCSCDILTGLYRCGDVVTFVLRNYVTRYIRTGTQKCVEVKHNEAQQDKAGVVKNGEWKPTETAITPYLDFLLKTKLSADRAEKVVMILAGKGLTHRGFVRGVKRAVKKSEYADLNKYLPGYVPPVKDVSGVVQEGENSGQPA